MRSLFAIAALAGCVATGALAADIRVAPVTVDPPAQAQTGTITVTNGEQRPVNVQIRVFKWSQSGGADTLTPTSDVVASPPSATLSPKQDYVVRLVRVTKTPVQGEESYRVMVDEVPELGAPRDGNVRLVLRQSIPVFFSNAPERVARLNWKIEGAGANAQLVAANTGDRRARFSDLSVTSNGATLLSSQGLSGYALAGSEMRWPIKSPTGPAKLTGQSDVGPIDVALGRAP